MLGKFDRIKKNQLIKKGVVLFFDSRNRSL